jgi:hypothetical protein
MLTDVRADRFASHHAVCLWLPMYMADCCLLARPLAADGDEPSSSDAAAADAAVAAAAGASGDNAGGVLDSSAAWIKLAAQLPADIQQQPSMVKGGQLREYQMQVRLACIHNCMAAAC